jgi:hypothetical protein
MLSQISTRQFQEWREYSDLEPWDEERADLRAATIVQAATNGTLALASVLARRKGKPPTVALKDCVLAFGPAAEAPPVPPPATPERAREDVRRTLDFLTQAFGKKRRPGRRRAQGA